MAQYLKTIYPNFYFLTLGLTWDTLILTSWRFISIGYLRHLAKEFFFLICILHLLQKSWQFDILLSSWTRSRTRSRTAVAESVVHFSSHWTSQIMFDILLDGQWGCCKCKKGCEYEPKFHNFYRRFWSTKKILTGFKSYDRTII